MLFPDFLACQAECPRQAGRGGESRTEKRLHQRIVNRLFPLKFFGFRVPRVTELVPLDLYRS